MAQPNTTHSFSSVYPWQELVRPSDGHSQELQSQQMAKGTLADVDEGGANGRKGQS